MINQSLDYGLLAIAATGYILAIYVYRAAPQYLVLVTLIFGSFYFFWGIIHHLRTQSFHARIVLEYFLVALLGVVLIATLLA